MNVRWRERKGKLHQSTRGCVWLCVCMHIYERHPQHIHSRWMYPDYPSASLIPSLSPYSVCSLFQQRDKSSAQSHHKTPHRRKKRLARALFCFIIVLTSKEYSQPKAKLVTLRCNSCRTMRICAPSWMEDEGKKDDIAVFSTTTTHAQGKLIACHFAPYLSLLPSSSLCSIQLYDQSMENRRRGEAQISSPTTACPPVHSTMIMKPFPTKLNAQRRNCASTLCTCTLCRVLYNLNQRFVSTCTSNKKVAMGYLQLFPIHYLVYGHSQKTDNWKSSTLWPMSVLIYRHSCCGQSKAGLLSSWGTGVLFAPIAIIEVPLDFTEVCKKLGGQREEEEGEMCTS